MTFPDSHHYLLRNAHIPLSLLPKHSDLIGDREGLCRVDMEIFQGKIKSWQPASSNTINLPSWDLQKRMILPCFIDVHTHLDKGHIWPRSPNVEGTFSTAITTVEQDAISFWQEEDVYRRMEFALKCSYVHGTIAIRTHLDALGQQAEISFSVFQALQKVWKDRLTLQAVCLVPLDYFQTLEGVKLANKVAELGGILGAFIVMNPQIETQLATLFKLAKERHLALDLHVDENGDPNSICLQKVAETALKLDFPFPILCGHCCSLAVQETAQVTHTLNLLKQTPIRIVSLPLCNLYLQDRKEGGMTPIWRGVTRVHELKKQGIPVAFASDNCRDPFHGFGDHDGLEVFSQAVKIAHLDSPHGDWINSVTKVPAQMMDCPSLGHIHPNFSADFIVFKARNYSELLSRNQSDRWVVRRGKLITETLPDYAELDDLMSG